MNDQKEIPILGLGVYQSRPGSETYNSVLTALKLGYRHIDTAALYANEADVGRAVRDSKIARSEIFVTTKLWNSDHGYDQARKAFDSSLSRLGLDYIDLYLLHWPVERKRLDSWRALLELRREGRARSIGVSNFMIPHLRELIDASGETPAVNQVELSPFLCQKELRNFCNDLRIIVEAYSPLTRGRMLGHPVILQLASRLQRTPAQIMLRWSIEHGCVVLPKSVTTKRIEENFRVFDFTLTAKDMVLLDSLDEEVRFSWDPTDVI